MYPPVTRRLCGSKACSRHRRPGFPERPHDLHREQASLPQCLLSLITCFHQPGSQVNPLATRAC
ncbi:Hypothetical protein PSEBR_m1037 [Pseudomonas brassicacearum subsp. brassicacearum NFM421]|uniref:Uncharacterized protein n=1 Tax=Pseudomonas brassicacearum (strain NFM421) TaxID=994484 RepID=F2KI82_PSEBN|nr:Hypothetical protein PSEBR_m1037 [Pseudomonas brassicacearum subsp. brassicacearum NFM421]